MQWKLSLWSRLENFPPRKIKWIGLVTWLRSDIANFVRFSMLEPRDWIVLQHPRLHMSCLEWLVVSQLWNVDDTTSTFFTGSRLISEILCMTLHERQNISSLFMFEKTCSRCRSELWWWRTGHPCTPQMLQAAVGILVLKNQKKEGYEYFSFWSPFYSLYCLWRFILPVEFFVTPFGINLIRSLCIKLMLCVLEQACFLNTL